MPELIIDLHVAKRIVKLLNDSALMIMGLGNTKEKLLLNNIDEIKNILEKETQLKEDVK